MAKDDVLYANPAEYVVDVIGAGAFHSNPWRQLSQSEATALVHRAPCMEAYLKARNSFTGWDKPVNGAYNFVFSCDGSMFMWQYVLQSHMTYWLVYNHPGPLVFAMKQSESPRTVPSRRPASLRGVPHWPGLGDAATDQQNADAIAMNNSLNDHGYKLADQYLYKAFQTDVGLNPDGYPGTKTMQELKDVLFALGVEMANVPIYPWLASGGYDGVNAPLMSDWNPGASATPATPPPATPSGTYVAPVTTVTGDVGQKSNAAILLIGGSAAAVAGGLGYWYWKKHKRGR